MLHTKIKGVVTVITVASALSVQLYAAPYKPVTQLSTGESLTVTANPTVKVGLEYEINGIKYKPNETNDYDVIGLASWYGKDFQGKLTANGEVYDMEQLTAAHGTLPLPSIVEVTNLENGKKVILRVNDRGPFSGGRAIDVSQRAAELLGFKDQGTAKVRITLLKEISDKVASDMPNNKGAVVSPISSNESVTPTALNSGNDLENINCILSDKELVVNNKNDAVEPAIVQNADITTDAEPIVNVSPVSDEKIDDKEIVISDSEQNMKPISLVEPSRVQSYVPRGVFVQIGAFSNNNERVRNDVNSLSDVGVVSLQKIDIDGKDVLRLRVGPYGSVDDAVKIKNRLVKLGYSDSRVVIEQ